MLAQLIVRHGHELPPKHLRAWLKRMASDCTDLRLDEEGRMVLLTGSREVRKLTDGTLVKVLRKCPPKLSIPLLYELCTALDLQDETSDLLYMDLEKLLDIDTGKGYVRWYASTPRRLAVDLPVRVTTQQRDKARQHGIRFYQSKDVPHEWIALWGFTKRLRGLLADHLEELLWHPSQR